MRNKKPAGYGTANFNKKKIVKSKPKRTEQEVEAGYRKYTNNKRTDEEIQKLKKGKFSRDKLKKGMQLERERIR
jgi:hypothetical protein